jgi:Ni2+-binding GTPase involved in maturation of urease and hydrogenase
VRVNLITGPLGAGKSTLLRGLLGRGLPGERVCVVLNERGQVGLDDCEATVVDLLAGCLCCEAVAELGHTLDEIARAGFDRALVEAAGTADVRLAQATLHQSSDLRCRVRVDVTIGVMDATRPHQAPAGADLVIVNRCDLAANAAADAASAAARAANPRAAILRAVRAEVEVVPLLQARAGGPFAAGSLCEPGLRVDDQRLIDFFEDLPAGILRASGTVQSGTGSYRLDWVGGNLDLEPAPAQGVDLVFVGTDVDRGLLRAGLGACRVEAIR